MTAEVDRLLRELITERRAPTVVEAAAIVDHIASAEFLSEASLRAHLEKRKEERQWHRETSPEEYARDAASIARRAHLLGLFERRGGNVVVLVARTADAIPGHRSAARALPLAIVVYAADRGKMISTYQFSQMSELAVPEDVLWLPLIPSQ